MTYDTGAKVDPPFEIVVAVTLIDVSFDVLDDFAGRFAGTAW